MFGKFWKCSRDRKLLPDTEPTEDLIQHRLVDCFAGYFSDGMERGAEVDGEDVDWIARCAGCAGSFHVCQSSAQCIELANGCQRWLAGLASLVCDRRVERAQEV